MHIYAVAAFCSLLPFTLAKCYKDTPPNTNPQFALDHVKDTAAFLQGSLVVGQVRGTCVSDTAAGNQWYFSVRNEKKTPIDVKKEVIEQYLRLEINGCSKNGGHRSHNSVEYKYVCKQVLQ